MDLRDEFPLERKIIYFDNGATSQTPKSVIAAVDRYYTEYRGSIHRGAHRLTIKASQEYEAVYDKLAKFFNASSQEFYSVRNSTEAINHVALGLDWKGGEVVTTLIEHHSNLLPWIRLEKQGKAKLRVVEPADKTGAFDVEDFKKAISKKTKLVSLTACSNVLGNKMPLQEITEIAHDAGALVLVDAAQYVGHHEADLRKLDCDFLAFSGHKCFAPTGVGVLFHREGVELEPAFLGGGTIQDAQLHDYKLLGHRERFEAGTPDIGGWIGLGAALDFISSVGYGRIREKEAALIKALHEGFSSLDGVTVYGPKDKSAPIFAFTVKGMDHHQVAVMIDELAGVCVRSGHHCCLPLTRWLGVAGTVRASLHFYNSVSEVETFFGALDKITSLA